MSNIRLGTRINRISSGKIGYVPSTDKSQRAIMKKHRDKVIPLYAIRDIQVYCYWKHNQLTYIDIATKFSIKPHRVRVIVNKVIKLFKEWRDNG